MLKNVRTILNFMEKYWWAFTALAVIFAYALIMTLARGQSIWFDEGYSILLAKHSVHDLISFTAVDAHPPFYYLLLKAWAGLFGWSEYALRSLSAVAAASTVGVALLFIRRIFTTRVMLVAIPFLVLAPFFLRYGYEVRMYALVGLIGLTATWVLVRALESKRNAWWALYAVLVALGMYTLYMSIVIWLAHFLWLVVKTIKVKKSLFKQKWFFAYIGAVVLFVPYLSTFIYQMTHSALPGIGHSITIDTLSGVLSLLISYIPSWQISGLLSIGLLLIVGFGIYLGVYSWKKSNKTQRSYLQLILFCFFVPMVFFVLISLSPKPFFIDRYVAHIAVFFYILLGIITALSWRYGKKLAAVFFGCLSIILMVFGVVQLQQTGNFNFERMQYPMTSSARQLVSCNGNTTVVADDPYTYIDARYYFDGCDLRFNSKQNVDFGGGYAPLRDSLYRVDGSKSINSKVLFHLRWSGAQATFTPDSRYHLVSSTTFNKQVVDCYILN